MTVKIKYGRGSRIIGIFLLITGSLLGVGSLLLVDVPRLKPAGEVGLVIQIICFLFPVPILVVGAFLYLRSRQYADETVAKRVISDSRLHVLYLRSFAADISTMGYVFSTLNLIKMASGWKTDEEQLVEVLQPFGDPVAIGKPGETLPTPGAARIYASDAEWEKVVTDKMQTAQLVVILAGTSGGLLWEFKKVVQVVNPKKLLITILNMRKKAYDSFIEDVEQIFNVTFPKGHELKRFGTISGFFRFSPNWSPIFLPLRAPFFRCGYNQYGGLFKFTLKSLFEEYGLEWKPPPVSILRIVLSIGIPALFCVHIVISYSKVFSWLVPLIKRLI
jgi:hypothetical protein